tara:strand:- start:77 stop:595 length:519 start_codon:yes stop_codon:yes gene_type:complete
MDYKDKYLKYKKKYLELQNQLGGMDSYTETEYMGGFRKMKGGMNPPSSEPQNCSKCVKTDKLYGKDIFGRTKQMEIDHLIRKFKGCDAGCTTQLKELKNKFVEWNNKKNDRTGKKINLREIEGENKLTLEQLKSAGFSLGELKEASFNSWRFHPNHKIVMNVVKVIKLEKWA